MYGCYTITTIVLNLRQLSLEWTQNYFVKFCVFIVNFEHISHLVLVFLLLTLSR